MSLTKKIKIWLLVRSNGKWKQLPRRFHYLIHTVDEQVIVVLHRDHLQFQFGNKVFLDLVRYLEAEGYTVLATAK